MKEYKDISRIERFLNETIFRGLVSLTGIESSFVSVTNSAVTNRPILYETSTSLAATAANTHTHPLSTLFQKHISRQYIISYRGD